MARVLAVVLVLGSTVSVPLFDLANLTFTGDRIVGIVAVLFVMAHALRTGFRWTPVHMALAVFVAVQIFTTLLNIRVWPHGIVLVTVYILGYGCFALTADVASAAPIRRFVAQLVIVAGGVAGLVASVLAIAANVSATQLPGTTRLLGTRSVVPAFSAHFIFSEPNFLGGFLLIPLTLYLWKSPEGVPRLFTLVTGIVYSCTRAAWLGMGAIVVACAWIRPFSRQATLTVICVIVLAFALLIATSGSAAFLQRTVMPFTVTRDNTMEYRVRISAAMLRSWLARPLVGHGAGAGHLVMLPLPSGRTLQGVWAGNAEVHLLQNSGVLGLAAFVLVIGVLWREVRRTAHRRGAAWATHGTPLCIVGIFLLFSFQFTHALWLMYPYVYLGLLTAEVGVDER